MNKKYYINCRSRTATTIGIPSILFITWLIFDIIWWWMFEYQLPHFWFCHSSPKGLCEKLWSKVVLYVQLYIAFVILRKLTMYVYLLHVLPFLETDYSGGSPNPSPLQTFLTQAMSLIIQPANKLAKSRQLSCRSIFKRLTYLNHMFIFNKIEMMSPQTLCRHKNHG